MSINIRASSLSSYIDCPRRAAASILKSELYTHGYVFNYSRRSIGASIGKASHYGSEVVVDSLIKQQSLPSSSFAVECAISKLKEELLCETIYDGITKDMNEAEKQTIILVNSFIKDALPHIVEPSNIETYREAEICGGFKLTGHSDIESIDAIYDLKFGARFNNYHQQLGAYSMLSNAHKEKKTDAVIVNIARTPIKKTFIGAQIKKYNVCECEDLAKFTIQRIISDINLYNKTQNPNSFCANPSSVLCGAKYCPCYNTNWCKMGIK